MKISFLSAVVMAVVIFTSCAKEAEAPSSSSADSTSQSKSSLSLAERISSADALENLVLTSNSLASESLVPGYEQYLNVDPNSITSKTDLRNLYSNIFIDELSALNKVERLKSNAVALRTSFPELSRMNDIQLTSILSEAYDLYLDDNPQAISLTCTNPSCAESTAIGAVMCLPSLFAAGWGYAFCAVGVVIQAVHCCNS